jgi:hypothetical protein
MAGRKISMNVPDVVQRDQGDHGDARPGQPVPPGQSEETVVGERGGRLGDAEPAVDDLQDAGRIAEPVRPVQAEVAQHPVDDSGAREDVQEDDGDRHRAGDGREVVGGAEESPPGQPLPGDREREPERERRLQRDDENHVVQVVAQALAELLLREAGLG